MIDSNKYKYRFSVFTATMNRASMLWRLYQDLKKQTYKDFEWVIVNDGSSDNTDDVVKKIIAERTIDVQYVNKENGGKHTAWKIAIPIFKGRYILTADDDDPVTKDMLEIFNYHWTILERSQQYNDFWEIRTGCKRVDGTLVGQELPSSIFDSDYNIMSYKLKVFCEMVGCRKVEVLRNEACVPDKFKFMEAASNFDEAIRWSRAARIYKTRFVSDVTRIYNETPNSLSANVFARCLRGEKKIVANKMVEFYYTLLEKSDLLLKYDKKRYVKTLLGYAFLIGLNGNRKDAIDGLSYMQKTMLTCLIPVLKILIWIKRK